MKRGLIVLLIINASLIFLATGVFASTPGNVTTCQALDTNGTYFLNRTLANENVTSPCFSITSANVTLDCQGFAIYNTSLNGTGVSSGMINTTIKNCNITLGTLKNSIAIQLIGANYSSITNNSLYKEGIGLLMDSVYHSFVQNNTCKWNTNDGASFGIGEISHAIGFRIVSSVNNTFRGNVIDSNGGSLRGSSYGIQMVNSPNTFFTNLTVTNTTSIISTCTGISIESSNNTTIVNSRIFNTSTYGINIQTSNYLNLTNVTVESSGSLQGIEVYGSVNATLQFITARFNGAEGIALDGEVYNSTVSNSTLTHNAVSGIRVTGFNNLIINVNASNNSDNGIVLGQGAYNRVINNTVFNNLDWGIAFSNGEENSTMTGNLIMNNQRAFVIDTSYNITATNNNITGNMMDLHIEGIENRQFNHTIGRSNVFSYNKHLYYNISLSNYEFNDTVASDANAVYCILCNNVTYRNLNLTRSYLAAYMFNSTNITLTNISVETSAQGVTLVYTSNSRITNNTLRTKHEHLNSNKGISIVSSSYNIFTNNYIDSQTRAWGIYVQDSASNIFTNGVVNNSGYDAGQDAIEMYSSSENVNNNTFSNISIINTNVSGYDFRINADHTNGTNLIDMIIANYSFGLEGSEITFESTRYGKIIFTGNISGTGTNLSNDIQINSNQAIINATSQLGLNASANITLYNLPTNFITPVIYRDGSACPSSICTALTSLNAGNVGFNVTGEGSYSIIETGSTSGSSGSSGSSSSGGGSGGGYIPPKTTSKEEKRFDINDHSLNQGISFVLNKNVTLVISSENNLFELTQIYTNATGVLFRTNEVEHRTIWIGLGEKVKLDIDTDGINELEISLEAINSDNLGLKIRRIETPALEVVNSENQPTDYNLSFFVIAALIIVAIGIIVVRKVIFK